MLIKRYFALMLMLFTVVSNASDSLARYDAGASGSVRLVFVSKLNEILSSNIQKVNIAAKKQNIDKNSFGDIVNGQIASSFGITILLAIAFILCCMFINNGIVKNSIWRSAVF